jgi:hypothetical protein
MKKHFCHINGSRSGFGKYEMGMFCESVNHYKNTIMSFLVFRQTHNEVHTNGLPLVIKDPQ